MTGDELDLRFMAFKNNITNQNGVTLLEMVVAVAIFSVVVLSATSIFKMAIDGQRNAIAAQNMQESMRYAFEVISKEMRTAQKSSAGTCIGSGKIFVTANNNDDLSFINKSGECVRYGLENNRLKIVRSDNSDFITPDEVKISDLEFDVTDDVASKQSLVTIMMDIEAVGQAMHKQPIKIQTTISSRYYE